MPYSFKDDIAVADVAFEATGATLDEVFRDCAAAVTATMVKDASVLKPRVARKLELKAGTTEQLLHDFLEELVFVKDAHLLLFGRTEVRVHPDGKSLKAVLFGEKLDPKRHELLVDVKAVTWHGFSLAKRAGGWTATGVLDV